MTANILGQGVKVDGGTMVERAANNRRGGGVHDQRNTELAADIGHFLRTNRRGAEAVARLAATLEG